MVLRRCGSISQEDARGLTRPNPSHLSFHVGLPSLQAVNCQVADEVWKECRIWPEARVESSGDMTRLASIYVCLKNILCILFESKPATFAAFCHLPYMTTAPHPPFLTISCFGPRLSLRLDRVPLLFDLAMQRRRERVRKISTSRASMAAFEEVSAAGWGRVVLRSICRCQL